MQKFVAFTKLTDKGLQKIRSEAGLLDLANYGA
jgi:hypothetical protein